MQYISIGIDVSKGRADIAILNQSGTMLAGSGGYDDTRAGHDQLAQALRQLREAYPTARFLAGYEATGGYERTWAAFFQRQRQAGHQVAAHRLNPLAVKRYLAADLHRKVDDARAAQGIARYLLERLRAKEPHAVPLDGRVVFYRNIRALIKQRVAQRLRFQALLSSTNPELVQYCQNDIPKWLLSVCQQYPTAAHLARGRLETLAAIPHVGRQRAEALRTAAKQSTAALTDAGAAAAMTLLTEELLHMDQRINDLQKALIRMMADDPRVALIDSIPGVAAWSAVALVLEIGDVTRFADVRQLVAWAGLDPRVDSSGDQTVTHGISHRGNSALRGILYALARACMLHNPVIADFIRAKINDGKPNKVATVAGAAKLLRIVYALLVSEKTFDPEHEASRAAAAAQQRQQARAQPDKPVPPQAPATDCTAPVSAAERRRRKARAAAASNNNAAARTSQACEVKPQRDRRAAAPKASPTTA